jgi:hypothetical protein
MNAEIERALLAKYAFLRLVRCLAVGDGWTELLFKLFHSIQSLLERDPTATLEITGMKSKLGQLRIFGSYNSDAIGQLLAEAETDSSRICEVCGKPGRLYRDKSGWVAVHCDEHRRGVDIFMVWERKGPKLQKLGELKN